MIFASFTLSYQSLYFPSTIDICMMQVLFYINIFVKLQLENVVLQNTFFLLYSYLSIFEVFFFVNLFWG